MNILKYVKYTLVPVALACAVSVSAYAKEPDSLTWDAKAPSTPTEALQKMTQTLKSIVDLPSAQEATPKIISLCVLIFTSEAHMEQMEDTEQIEFEVACFEFTIVLLTKRETFERIAKQDKVFGFIIKGMYRGLDAGMTELGL